MYTEEKLFRILKNGELVPATMEEWGRWFGNPKSEGRPLCRDEVGPYRISTVCLGMNHGHFTEFEKPLWFETMIFGGRFDKEDEYQQRYTTLEEAREGHKRAVEFAKSLEAKP